MRRYDACEMGSISRREREIAAMLNDWGSRIQSVVHSTESIPAMMRVNRKANQAMIAAERMEAALYRELMNYEPHCRHSVIKNIGTCGVHRSWF